MVNQGRVGRPPVFNTEFFFIRTDNSPPVVKSCRGYFKMRTKQDIIQFIEINHPLMSVKQMAKELGVPEKKVYKTCYDRGWIPVNAIDGKKLPLTSDMIAGLKEVAAQMMEGATEEEKKLFYKNCMTEKVKR
jgi:hypothetical protein